MKLWPWGLLLIGLIGVAAAAVVITISLPGTVTIVSPGLIATPSSLAWPQVTTGLQPVSVTVPFTLTNNGQIDLSITWAFTCSNCPTGVTGTILLGGTIYPQNSGLTSATPNNVVNLIAQLTVASGTIAGTYNPGFSISGNSP